jgi:transcriptional regulator with GAF, ATPase, and Fis domain
VGELPLEVQAKLLRVLESGEVKPVGTTRPFHVDVRVVAATHRELKQWARQGQFRVDLFYRLNVMPVGLPPLRSRRGDLRLLAEHFVRAFAPQEQAPQFTPTALARLQQHDWRGNIRELHNVVQLALLMRRGLSWTPQTSPSTSPPLTPRSRTRALRHSSYRRASHWTR